MCLEVESGSKAIQNLGWWDFGGGKSVAKTIICKESISPLDLRPSLCSVPCCLCHSLPLARSQASSKARSALEPCFLPEAISFLSSIFAGLLRGPIVERFLASSISSSRFANSSSAQALACDDRKSLSWSAT